jgi:hypothetical protein
MNKEKTQNEHFIKLDTVTGLSIFFKSSSTSPFTGGIFFIKI